MLLLEGNDLWVNLKTSFVDVDRLLLVLKQQKFSGYLYFEFGGSRCALFVQQGDTTNGVVALDEERDVGAPAVKRILLRCRQDKDGSIRVTRVPLPHMEILSAAYGMSVRLLHKNLSSQYSNLIKFVEKLLAESFSGWIEVSFNADERRGTIFLEDGRPRAVMTTELLVDLKEQTRAQRKFLWSFVGKAQRSGVRYSVFAAA